MQNRKRQPLTDRSDMSLAAEPATYNLDRLNYDYSQIGEEHRERVQYATIAIQDHMRRTADSLIRAGKELLEVKAILSHGQFGEWLEVEFGMSHSTANNWMNAAKVYGDKIPTVGNLSQTALILLAAPNTPEAAREEVEAQVQATGKSPTRKEVESVVEKHKLPKPESEPVTPAPPDGYTLQHHPGRGWQWQRALDEYTTIAGNILSTAEEAVAEAEHDLAERHARKAAKTTHFAPRAEPLRHPVATGWPDDAEAGWRYMESQNARFDAAGYKLQYNYPAHKQGEPCMRWVRIGADGTPVYGETVGGGNERSRVIEDALLAQGEPFAASYAGAKVVYVEPVPEPAPESEPPVAKPARGTPEYAAYRAQACRAAIGEAEKWLATLDEIGELTGLYGQATRDKRSVREWITVLARHAE